MRCVLDRKKTAFGKEFRVTLKNERLGIGTFIVGLVTILTVLVYGCLTAIIFGLLFVLIQCWNVTSEKLILWEGMGITFESRRRCGLVNRTLHEFEKIEGIAVNEVITTGDVRYYLVLLIKGKSELAVAFKHCKPRLEIVKEVYREIHSVKGIG